MLDACRACTAKEPARRIANAARRGGCSRSGGGGGRGVRRRRGGRWFRRGRIDGRRPASAWCACRGRGRARAQSIGRSPLVSYGQPADWTDVRACSRRFPTASSVRACSPISARSASSGERRRAPRTSTPSRASASRRRSSRPPTPRAARPLARRQAPRLPGPCRRPPRFRLPFTTSGRKRRRPCRSHRRAVDVLRADLARATATCSRSTSIRNTWACSRRRRPHEDPPEVTAKPYLTSFRSVNGEPGSSSRRSSRPARRRIPTLDPRPDSRTEVSAAPGGYDLRSAGSRSLLRESPPRTIRRAGGSERLDASEGRVLGRLRRRRSGIRCSRPTGLAFVGLRFGTDVGRRWAGRRSSPVDRRLRCPLSGALWSGHRRGCGEPIERRSNAGASTAGSSRR